jgi:hypothetical protein
MRGKEYKCDHWMRSLLLATDRMIASWHLRGINRNRGKGLSDLLLLSPEKKDLGWSADGLGDWG